MGRSNNLLPLNKKQLKHINFRESLEEFKLNMKIENLASRTIEFHMENLHVLDKIFREQGIELNPSAITAKLIRDYFILYMLECGYKVNTINGRIKTTRKYLRFLYEEGYIGIDISQSLKKVKGKTNHIEAFSKDQLELLLKAPDQSKFTGYRDYVIMILLLDTGIRLSELCKLGVSNVDLKGGVLKLDETVAAKGGEGEVPVSAKCCKVLKKYLEYRQNREPLCDNVFITIDGVALNRNTIQEDLRNYGKKVALKNVRVSPHTFRHSMAKLYILAGGDPFSLQKILRHKNMDTVRIYVNLWGCEVKLQHDKFSPLNSF